MQNNNEAEFLIELQKDIAKDLSVTLSLHNASHILLENLLRINDFFGGAVFLFNNKNELCFEYQVGIDSLNNKIFFQADSLETTLTQKQEVTIIKRQTNNNEFNVFEKIEKANYFIVSPINLNKEIVGSILLISSKSDLPKKIVTNTVEAVTAKIGGIVGRIDIENLLKEQQNNLHSLFTGISDILLIINTEGRIIHFNPVACEKLGYTEDELGNKNLNQLHPSELSFDIKNILEKAIKVNNTLSLFPYITANNEIIPAETKFSHGKWNNKEMLFLVVRDLRERKMAQEELTLARKKAEEANKAKTVFLANMSHAFRIPMNSIIGMSELLLKTDLTKKQFNFLNVIIKSAENLMMIVNDLLDISKIESGEITLNNKTFSLKDVISSVINNQFYNVRNKGIELLSDYVVYGEDYYLKGDSARLNQILLNLVENAIKFTEKGKIEIKIDKQNSCNNLCKFYFEVSDTGTGISTDRLNEIYSSINNNRPITTETNGSSGLGIVISNKLIEIMGGKLEINTEPEKGSTFKFSLQFEAGNEHELLIDSSDNKIQKHPIDNIKILLAEDQVFNQMVVQSMVEDWGFEIDIVDNGFQAIDKLKNNTYDVILMDIQMPEMDGIEATKHIRNNLQKPVSETPIIAITANAYSNDHKKYLEFGMNDTISKPFKSQILFHKIANLLGMSNSNFLHYNENYSDIELISINSNENLYDLSALKGISKGKKNAVDNMLKVFIDKSAEEMQSIKSSFEKNNIKQIASVAHKMKPALAYLGMKLLESKINEIQLLANENNNIEKIGYLITQSEQLLAKIVSRLKQEIS